MKMKLTKYDIGIVVILIAIVVVIVAISIYTITHRTRDVEVDEVKDYSLYFMVVNNINTFYEYVSNNDNDAVISLLDNKYIEKENITRNNLNTHILNYGIDIGVIPDYITTFKIDNNIAYFVHGKLEQTIYLEPSKIVNNNFNMLMLIDIDNLTFSLYPTTEEEYKQILSTIPSINITKNNYNEYQGVSEMSNQSVCVIYLTDFLSKLENNIDSTYELISKNTLAKLSTIDKYRDYINQNIGNYTTKVDRCAVTGDSIVGKTFRVYDANNNYFEFIENGIMKYHVNLEIAYEKEETTESN